MLRLRMVRAVRVAALEGFQLQIVFSDGTEGVMDLSAHIKPGPVTGPLMDPTFFARVFIDGGVPTWPNGFDIDAINAHMQLEAAGALRRTTEAA